MSILQTLREKLGDSNSRVLRGMGLITLFLIVGKIFGAVKEMAIAYRFGTDEVVDVYVYAFVLVSWIPVVAHSVLQSVLVPLLSKLKADQRRQFVGQLTAFVLFSGTIVSLLVIFVVPVLIPLIAGGMSNSGQADIRTSLALLAPCCVLMFVVALYSAELLSREKHANTLLEALPPLSILICVVVWPSIEFSVLPLLVGTLVGVSLQAMALLYISKDALAIGKISFSFSNSAWAGFWKACSILVVGVLVLSVVLPFDQYLASQLGEGAVASLSYASRLLALGLVLGTTVLSRAILPVLSDDSLSVIAKAQLAKRWAILIFLAGICAGLVAWFITPVAVQLLYERGAFTSDDTIQVSAIVRAGLFQMPFLFAGMVLVQLFTSIGDYGRLALSSFLGVAVKVVGGLILVRHFGVSGIALATGMMYASTFLFFFWSAKYRLAESVTPNA